MRPRSSVGLAAVALAALGAGTGAVRAGGKKPAVIAGEYLVKFTQVANTCTQGSIALDGASGTFAFEQKGKKLVVSFALTPIMRGSVDPDAKFTARARRGGTAIQDMDGEFSVAGAVTGGKEIELVMVGKYFFSGAPLCEQSWTAKGQKKTPAKP